MSDHLRFEKQNGEHCNFKKKLSESKKPNIFLKIILVVTRWTTSINKKFSLFYLNKKERILGPKMEFSAFCIRFLKMSTFYLLFGGSPIVTTSMIFKNIFGFFVSDHFFENFHARRFASRSGDDWTPTFVALRVCKNFFVCNVSGQINP